MEYGYFRSGIDQPGTEGTKMENYMSAPNARSLEAFVEGVKLITGQDNPTYFIESGHDIIWICGDYEPETDSDDGKKLESLGFHHDSDGWAWFT